MGGEGVSDDEQLKTTANTRMRRRCVTGGFLNEDRIVELCDQALEAAVLRIEASTMMPITAIGDLALHDGLATKDIPDRTA